MPSVFVVPCPALPARCSVRFSRFRPGHLGPARLPSGARAPSSGEEVIYPHAGGLSREEGDFSGKIFAGGGGRAAPGAAAVLSKTDYMICRLIPNSELSSFVRNSLF